jgi:hypothetical protein
MRSPSLARDTAVLVAVKIAVLLAIGFFLFGKAQRPHVDVGAHLLAAAPPATPAR